MTPRPSPSSAATPQDTKAEQNRKPATSAGGPKLRLCGTLPNSQITLYNNSASGNGGVFYLGSGSAAVHATACVFDTQLASNKAKLGGSVAYAENNAHLAFNAEGDPECNFDDAAALGAQHCDPISGCPTFITNAGSDGTNPTSAPLLLTFGNAVISARRARFDSNTGGALVKTQSAAGATVD